MRANLGCDIEDASCKFRRKHGFCLHNQERALSIEWLTSPGLEAKAPPIIEMLHLLNDLCLQLIISPLLRLMDTAEPLQIRLPIVQVLLIQVAEVCECPLQLPCQSSPSCTLHLRPWSLSTIFHMHHHSAKIAKT
jgi:hypothetical protein